MVIEKFNDMKMKLGSRVKLGKTGKANVDSVKAANSAKRKRVKEVMDMCQGDNRLPGTDRKLTDVTMVPPILTASHKTKRSDRTLTRATLEIEILSQCGKSTLRDFRPS